MSLLNPSTEWLIRAAEAEAEAGMFISAGTGRGDYNPLPEQGGQIMGFIPSEIDNMKRLVEVHGKDRMIDLIQSLG